MDRIDADAIGGIVYRADLAQHAHGALGPVIGGSAGGADYSVNRRDVDDRAAAAFAHRGNRGLHPEPHALLIHGDHAVPFLFAGVLDSAEVEDAGVVYEDVEAAELALAGVERGAPIRGPGGSEMDRNSNAEGRR